MNLKIDSISYLFTIIFLFYVSFYHLFIYIGRRTVKEEKYNLYFSITIFFLAVFYINLYFYYEIFKEKEMLLRILTAVIAFILFHFFKLFLLYFFYIKNKSNLIIKILYACIIISIAMSFTSYFNNQFLYNKILLPIIVVLVTGSFVFIILYYLLKIHFTANVKKTNPIFSIAALCVILYILIDRIFIAFFNNYLLSNYVYFIGIVAVLFSISLTNKFNKEYKELIILKNTLEKKVEKRTQQLKEAHEQKTNYFINLAHETKTPLTIINNYLNSYIKESGSNKKLEIIKDNIDKLSNDMINFLDAEKFSKNIQIYNHNQIINLSETVDKKLDLFYEYALSNKINIKKNINTGIFIKADPFAIDRVLNNLLSNAVKFTGKHGVITVELFKDNLINLIIKDTGIGIPNEKIKNIFNPYYQISHNKQNIQGIGMGLYITKEIINSLQGKITVESKINEGSIFKINLIPETSQIYESVKFFKPIMPNISKSYKTTEIKDSAFLKDRKSILIVEDNRNLLQYLKEELSKEHNIYVSLNGADALKKLKNINTDLIISDIMMDQMDGFEFIKLVSNDENYSSIPFIFLTAKTNDNDKLLGLQNGAIDFIKKPFDIDELKAKIKSVFKYSEKRKKSDLKTAIKIIENNILNNNNSNINIEKQLQNFKITNRQKEIVLLMKEGMEYKEIADNLSVAVKTIKNHIDILFKKFHVNNKIELLNKIFYE